MTYFLGECFDFDVTFDADFVILGLTLSSTDNSCFLSQFDFVVVLVARFLVFVSEKLRIVSNY